MPITTDLNVSPYFDDYDEAKNFHRILFRPATAVQARELTQLQSILQNQIERFGNWAFKNGDIVTGCAVIDIPVLPYVRIQDFQANGSSFLIDNLVGCVVNTSSSNLQARVIAVESGLLSYYPNTDPVYDTNKIYIKYINSGENGEIRYSNTDSLEFWSATPTGNTQVDLIATVNTYINSSPGTYTTGNAHGISVTDGIVYLNGNFVRVEDSTVGIVNNHGTYAANNLVGFTAIETIVNENQDESLLDNALGYTNENAPGAHRLKITPTLISLDPNTAANTEGFNPVATYNFGSIVTKQTSDTRLSGAIEDAIAKRTFEESGNYVVNPFTIDSASDLTNVVSTYGTANGVFARVSPGIGYASGYRVEVLNTTYIDMRRGLDTKTDTDIQISFNYGGYYLVNEVAGTFEFDSAETVKLYDTPQQAVTNRLFGSLTPVGTQIGTAKLRCFTYLNGPAGSNTANYAIHIFNVNLDPGYNVTNIRSFYYDGTNKGVADIVPGAKRSVGQMFFGFGLSGVKNLRDSGDNLNTQYTYRKKLSGTMATSGNVTITLPASLPGVNQDILPFGTGILSDLNAARFILIATANNASNTSLTGTVSTYTVNTHVSGVSTNFTSQFVVGDQISVGSEVRTITTINNNLSMEVDRPFSTGSSGANYFKQILSGKILSLTQASVVPGFINVTNSTSFTISSGLKPSSSVSVDVVFDVLRTNAVPAKKVIKKNRFVKLDTTSRPNGPWCLGFSDVYQVSKIYGSAGGYANSTGIIGRDLTSYFSLDTGQRDDQYGLAHLYPKPGFTSAANPFLLVQLDYFTVNTVPGTGFFTIESYPIDDANTANTNAIQTENFPSYVTDNGNLINLRDYIDFRTPVVSTATDTGDIDIANTTQLTAAINLASVNPSNTVTFSAPLDGLKIPSYGQTMQTDATYYLPRKDLIYITKDNILKVKEGVSSLNPQDPYCPDNSMAIGIVNMPAFPSLSSNEVDYLSSVNKTAKSLIRDTRYFISSTITTNRGYTMRDIGKFDQRIKTLEYYTQLSLLEKKAADMTVTDANGLDRFKNGIFVENFSDFSTSDVSNPQYSIAIDRNTAIARPYVVREVIKIDFQSSGSTAQKTGRVVTLPYTETAFLVQPYATKFRNAALVAFAWNGRLTLVPAYDNHKDSVNTGSLNITVDTSTPWEKFANSPMGTVWGEWRTAGSVKALYVGNPYYEGLLEAAGFGSMAVPGQSATTEAYIRANIWTYLNRVGYTEGQYTLGNLSFNYVEEGVATFEDFGLSENDITFADAKTLGIPTPWPV